MNKWNTWYDNLSSHTREYLKTQPLWHDRDMFKALVYGIAIGLLIGLVL
jgi:hypothetical protein